MKAVNQSIGNECYRNVHGNLYWNGSQYGLWIEVLNDVGSNLEC